MGKPGLSSTILFTLDVEEFDTAVEFGHPIALAEQIAVSTRGLRLLSDRFDAVGARTTLFTTAKSEGQLYSSGITLICLFVCGYFKAKVTGQPPISGALKVMLIGAAAAFGVARLFGG